MVWLGAACQVTLAERTPPSVVGELEAGHHRPQLLAAAATSNQTLSLRIGPPTLMPQSVKSVIFAAVRPAAACSLSTLSLCSPSSS